MDISLIPQGAEQDSRALQLINGFLQRFYDYEFEGIDNLDQDKPSVLVGNHSIYAYDVAIMLVELKRRKGIQLRTLGDRSHAKIPLWRDVLENSGVVAGTPENCKRLMQAGEHILVFPGGAREAFKRAGEEHRLFWKSRTGFARMAVANGYPITPFFVYGADLGYDILWDYSKMQNHRLLSPLFRQDGKLNKLLRDGELFPPIVRGRYNTMLPKRTPIQFRFGRPISTKKYKGATDADTLWEVRQRVENAVTALKRRASRDAQGNRRATGT